jgi:hypothetical protein
MKLNICACSIGALICPALLFLSGCSSSSPQTTISATSGSGQSALTSASFSTPMSATVSKGGKPVAGVQVTFTAPSSGASGSFQNGTATETQTTDSSGLATSSTFTANSTGGAYSVTATASGATGSATFSLTNTAATFYSFYLSGQEAINETSNGPNYYALAGSVAVDANGNVVAGVQDYNDAFGVTSPQPGGDSITGGSMAVDAAGQGTLTLITDNSVLGAAGTETLGVQFVNANHALVVEFDDSATSSGSLDLQTLPSSLTGGYAFTMSGVDPSYHPLAYGGVFSVSSGAVNGMADLASSAGGTLGIAFNGSIAAADNFGRGQITGVTINGEVLALNYYVVGPEAIRIIEIDTGQSVIGSAFGQGTNATTASSASLGTSVFGVQGVSWGFTLYAEAGMVTPHSGSTFTGIADNNEEGNIVSASAISGAYSLASNGYGSLAITNSGLLDSSSFGLYVTDPNLNLLDPNSTTGGGGALLLELDSTLAGGTGIAIPQTDTSTSSFTGSYAFGAQDFNGSSAVGWEFDYAGHGSVASGVLTGTGLVSDAFGFFAATPKAYSAVPFSGTATNDEAHPGRYTMSLDITATGGSPAAFSVAIYQANSGVLFWIDEDVMSVFLGTLQQETASQPGLRKPSMRSAKTKWKTR